VRAWAEILVRPRTFFASNVAPGDQAPGLTFLAMVVLVEETTRHVLTPEAFPQIGSGPRLSALVWLLVAIVFVAPAVTHLVAAIQTLVLAATVPDRGGVSETVQVLCYATAPCVLAGVPNPWLQSLVVVWGAGLYGVGLAVVHQVRLPVALAVGAVPAIIVFGYGFWGIGALSAVLDVLATAVSNAV
jgi:hypothetical protein